MNRTVLQIPMTKELKISAEQAAYDFGFSSLQELLRVFMKKLSSKSINLNFNDEPVIKLSAKNEKRYIKMTEDFKSGKNTHTANSLEEFFKQLDLS